MLLDEPDDIEEAFLIIVPPELNELTDCEEMDENEEDLFICNIPKDIPGTIDLEIRKKSDEDDEIREDKASTNDPSASQNTFEKEQLCNVYLFTENLNNVLRKISEADSAFMIFKMMLSDEILEHICEQSLVYARVTNNDSNFNIDKEELEVFIAILLFSGYLKLPGEKYYWSLEESMRVDLVNQAMDRDRFLTIKKYIHFADNREAHQSSDRMFKIRPLINIIKKNFQQFGVFHKSISIDESMIEYHVKPLIGKDLQVEYHRKEFIKYKPVQLGYKNWMMASSTGFCYDFDIYSGRDEVYPRSIPLPVKVEINSLIEIEDPKDHVDFLDDFFTTHSLMGILGDMKKKATDTVSESYIKGKSKNAETKTNVEQSHIYIIDNSRISGVDNVNQNVNAHRITMRGKKWWWVIFTYLIDLCMVNAWKLNLLRNNNSIKVQYNFRLAVIKKILLEAQSKNTKRKRKPSIPE
ncbi:piggyBac transposable element-derived protein 3-like [Condylostylus longicornis]|uniref:piggyBac transposable element-derived protein 3-like n=1 Tax=Condylostylus longicornis TaxID=2530218 RepID=UPI00244E558E|nr:piggyBac transposable element-derived protein 3-like [Condylostylus longicornis]